MRHDVLRKCLMGEPFEPTSSGDVSWLTWATEHKPLFSPSTYTPTGRRLNHFCVGSDPEFAFSNGGDRVTALELNLKVGLAAGCDQNERLVELRPWPSPSVVEHVAGILTALRWMYRVYPRTGRYSWRAGAFFAGDGMGGHVHFGRKRPTRTEEVLALDGLATVLRYSGLFPLTEWDRRIRGDKLGQVYGKPGDFRIQKHGYEYRSLPSWLQSPVVAFIVITASKLAILDPAITTTWLKRTPMVPQTARNLLRSLAKYYRGRDDDAYILYHLLTRQGDLVFDIEHAADFAVNWGIDRNVPIRTEENSYILPACIKPHELEVHEVQEHLLHDAPLRHLMTIPPSFKYSLPNERFVWVPTIINPGRHSGFGDLIHNLVQSIEAPIYWHYTNNDRFTITGFAALLMTREEKRLLHAYNDCRIEAGPGGEPQGTVIEVPKALCQTTTIGRFRDTLLKSGIFPLWTVETVVKDSYEKWLCSRPAPKENKIWRNV